MTLRSPYTLSCKREAERGSGKEETHEHTIVGIGRWVRGYIISNGISAWSWFLSCNFSFFYIYKWQQITFTYIKQQEPNIPDPTLEGFQLVIVIVCNKNLIMSNVIETSHARMAYKTTTGMKLWNNLCLRRTSVRKCFHCSQELSNQYEKCSHDFVL